MALLSGCRAARPAEPSPPRPRPRRARRRRRAAAARRARGAARRRPGARAAPATSSATPPTPAPTGCFPQAVVMAHDADDVAKVLAYGRAQRHPGHLPRRRHQPQRPGPGRRDPGRRPPPLRRRRGRGRTARRRGSSPGTVLGHANRVLAPHGRKLGPDPASTDIATVGGVIANNSGGMRCGIDQGLLLDGALADLRPASGTTIDTAAPDAAERFAAAEPELAAGPGRDPRRDPRRRRAERAHPPQVRDQEHDRLPALRLPRRRRAAGDLPPAAGRLRGDARLRRRGGLRDRAAAGRARPPPGSTSRASTRRSPRSATWSRPAPPRSS